MDPREGAQTLCCHASAESSGGGAAAGKGAEMRGSGGNAGSLEPAPASGEVDMLGDSHAHVEHQPELHRPNSKAGVPFGSLDSASAVTSTVKGGDARRFALFFV